MSSFILAGSFGALINCLLASYFSSQFDHLLQDFLKDFLHPVASAKTIAPALSGFFGGTLVVLVWRFLKFRVVRSLLEYNGWFLHPKMPVNKVSRNFVY